MTNVIDVYVNYLRIKLEFVFGLWLTHPCILLLEEGIGQSDSTNSELNPDKMNLDRHVIEAIKQSNYIFIIGNCSQKKVKVLAKVRAVPI
jgi:hypothetical protein